jgi:Tol biopolymer transport system component
MKIGTPPVFAAKTVASLFSCLCVFVFSPLLGSLPAQVSSPQVPRLVEIKQLTRGFNSRKAIAPCFSPDGRKIAFSGYRASEKFDALYQMNSDGTGLVRLFHGDSPVFDPTYAPDGSAICFNAGPSIYEYEIATDKTRCITADAMENQGLPVYTWDGRKILYCSSQGLRLALRAGAPSPAPAATGDTILAASSLPAVIPGSPVLSQVTTNPADRYPTCSHDGKEIAFVTVDQAGNPGICLTSTDTGGRQPLTMGEQRKAGGERLLAARRFGRPSWSPDDQFLIYDRQTGQQGNIYLFDRQAREETRLIGEERAACSGPTFAPDEKSIVFVRKTAHGQDIVQARLEGIRPVLVGDSVTLPPPVGPGLEASPTSTAKAETTKPDTTPRTLDRSQYRIVIFVADQSQGKALLNRLARQGYTNPSSYVSSNPAGGPSVKHHGLPRQIVDEIIEVSRQYMNLKLSPVTDPTLPEQTIYVNIP